MVQNRRFWRYLISKWYVFVVWAVFAVILWCWLVDLLIKPSNKEQVGIFVCSEICNQEELAEKLQKYRPDYVRQLNFKWVSPDDSLFAVYYDAFAVDASDVIVMPENKLNEFSWVDFLELDTEEVELYYGSEFNYYYADDGKAYGIEIDSRQFQTTGEVSYYMFFNKKSLHLGEWIGSSLDGALILAKVLLDTEI